MNESTQVALYTAEPQRKADLLPVESRTLGETFMSMFGIVGFDEMFESIQVIANMAKNLTDNELDGAEEVLYKWEKEVIDKVEGRIRFMRDLVSFFDQPRFEDSSLILGDIVLTREMMTSLANETDTQSSYVVFLNTLLVYQGSKNSFPDKPDVDDIDMTEAEKLAIKAEYARAVELLNIDTRRALRKTTMAFNEWILAMRDTKKVKDMLSVARVYQSQAESIISQCRGLATQGRLSLSVKNEETRKALLDMLVFARSL